MVTKYTASNLRILMYNLMGDTPTTHCTNRF